MMQQMIFYVSAVAAVVGAATAAEAGNTWKRDKRGAHAVRDCTPFNGRFGYYGNPWCDTGSYRLEDIEFRQRQSGYRRWKASKLR